VPPYPAPVRGSGYGGKTAADPGDGHRATRGPAAATHMKKLSVMSAALGVALLTFACASEPKQAVDAAKAALEAARTAGAADYAPEAFAAAETAMASLDAEIKAQSEKFALTRSYTKATELAAAATKAAEAATADAATGKEKMKAEATALIDEVKTAVTTTKELLAKAPKGKGSAADIEAMKTDVAGIESSLADVDAAMAAGRFKDAKVKAEAAKQGLDKIAADVQAAMAAKKAARK
jgi:hypothetical protein